MRILQLISSEGYYGAENVLVNLSRCLARCGLTVTVGVFDNRKSPHLEVADVARQCSLSVALVRCASRIDFGAVRSIREQLRGGVPTILHSHGYKSDVYGYLASRGLKAGLVSTYHLGCRGQWDRGMRLYAYNRLSRLVLRQFDKVVATSEEIHNFLTQSGLRPGRLVKIDNGVDTTHYTPAGAASLPTVAHLIGEGKTVGFVGRLNAQKGPDFFLEAARRVLVRHPQTRFLLAGDGPDRGRLEKVAASLGIAERVLFLGQVSNMVGVYASLDVLVLPSLNEGLPMTLLEALAMGRAVVASRVGATDRVIIHEQTGLLVKPRDTEGLADSIHRLLSDDSLRKRLGEGGQVHVQRHFSAERMAAQYVELYRQVLSN